ncbi:dioxygenase [Alteromonas mediterranea]|uniref:DODA-type extradiol aromatic ring-opening family dioxygenase n=1 Tax=Alteromonas mediterranea TaxID=314275 RepID=UPI0011321A1E|nr:class III extradiol ring-cleavage dioxygenase [Alteromonas mediterranea]QDG35004.1 dioxygenase [Alteromonas mediterranea]
MNGPTRISTAYISHGGGPLPLLEIQSQEGEMQTRYHTEMIETLITLPQEIAKPDVIIVISAHWEETVVKVTAGAKPDLIYDYYGFPKQAYSLKYPAKGNAEFANNIVNGLNTKGITAKAERTRGFDHGMFIPLSIMYPGADIPCVQVSLVTGSNKRRDAQFHISLGKALKEIIDNIGAFEHVLILGSGSSFHNMHGFFDSSEEALHKATRFNNWLQTTMRSSAYSETERKYRLVEWFTGPEAQYAHPKEEHLLPLHVCYGANNKAVDNAFSLTLLTKPASMFLWKG